MTPPLSTDTELVAALEDAASAFGFSQSGPDFSAMQDCRRELLRRLHELRASLGVRSQVAA